MRILLADFSALLLTVTSANSQAWKTCIRGSIGPGGCESILLVEMLYVDTMVVKREAKAQMEKTEKLRKLIEDDRKQIQKEVAPGG